MSELLQWHFYEKVYRRWVVLFIGPVEKFSEESGESIPYPSNLNICHLFPKRNHKSVQAHETNCIYLTWDEHSKLDNQYLDRHDFSGLEKAFPNSFKLIVERMRIVRASVTEKTKYVEAFDKFSESLDF